MCIRNDGFEVDSNRRAFTRESLAAAQAVVVVNAMGARYPFLPGAVAFLPLGPKSFDTLPSG